MTSAEIQQAYVGVGGYTLHSEQNAVVRTFAEETRVTNPIVTDMEEENATKLYPGQDMLMMMSQEYKIGNNLLNDPVGVNCTQLEGNYLNILARTSVMHNTEKSFESANINIDLFLITVTVRRTDQIQQSNSCRPTQGLRP